jgi:predicted hydrolase (HD superfamily)
MINREEAIILVSHYIKDKELIRNSFAVEAILKELAKKLKKDELLWSLTGLLYNLDYEYIGYELDKRGNLSSKLLYGLLPENAINAIMSNNFTHTNVIPTTTLDKALISSDAVKDLIFIVAQSTPSNNLKDVDFDTLFNKFIDNNFAVNVNRNKIRLCIDFGIELESFLKISLNTLKQLSEKFSI